MLERPLSHYWTSPLRSIKAYLCPNITNFDAVDFSERRPEEVISFFWRSVYFMLRMLLVKSCHMKELVLNSINDVM